MPRKADEHKSPYSGRRIAVKSAPAAEPVDEDDFSWDMGCPIAAYDAAWDAIRGKPKCRKRRRQWRGEGHNKQVAGSKWCRKDPHTRAFREAKTLTAVEIFGPIVDQLDRIGGPVRKSAKVAPGRAIVSEG